MNSDDGSSGRHAMSTGSCSPVTNGWIVSRGGLSPVGPPLAGALVGEAAVEGAALDGAADASGDADAEVAGEADGAGEGVGLLQPVTAIRTRSTGRTRRPIRGC